MRKSIGLGMNCDGRQLYIEAFTHLHMLATS